MCHILSGNKTPASIHINGSRLSHRGEVSLCFIRLEVVKTVSPFIGNAGLVLTKYIGNVQM